MSVFTRGSVTRRLIGGGGKIAVALSAMPTFGQHDLFSGDGNIRQLYLALFFDHKYFCTQGKLGSVEPRNVRFYVRRHGTPFEAENFVEAIVKSVFRFAQQSRSRLPYLRRRHRDRPWDELHGGLLLHRRHYLLWSYA